MPFQFALKINYVPELQRIIKEQLQLILNMPLHTEVANDQIHTYAHEARKATKRLRAILQLLKPVLKEVDFKVALRTFEQIANMLAELRDANSRLLAIERLIITFNQREDHTSLVVVRNYLKTELTQIEQKDYVEIFNQISQHTSYIEYQMRNWVIDKPGRMLIFTSIEKIYRKARKLVRKAYKHNQHDLLHAFRKQNKFLLHHTELISNIWPEVMEAYISEFEKLSDLLGEEHDLALLHTYIETLTNNNELSDEVGTALALISNRRTYLQNSIFHLQSKIYVDSPKSFAKRLRKYWDNWQANEAFEYKEEF